MVIAREPSGDRADEPRRSARLDFRWVATLALVAAFFPMFTPTGAGAAGWSTTMVVEQKVVAIGYGAYGGPEDATELMGSLGSDVFRFLGEESRIPRVQG